jgi:hypothetical protein
VAILEAMTDGDNRNLPPPQVKSHGRPAMGL